MKPSLPLDSLQIDREAAMPLQRQLYRALMTLIVDETLGPGVSLPSSRTLAQDLGVSRNTVTLAYDQLATDGLLQSRQGARPTVVGLPARTRPPAELVPGGNPHNLSRRGRLMMSQPVHHGEPGRMMFHPGMPDAKLFPFGSWSRILARRAGHGGETLFGTYNVAGHPDLRVAIAAYVKAARGVRCTPEQIVVTTGAQAALDLLARLLLDPGDDAWMEEPGYYGAQSAFVSAGANLVPLRVDEHGWVLEPPESDRVRAVYVTPSCHYPLGATMDPEQRAQLLDVAERRNAWVIEDDFDSEYRFAGQPIPAVQTADPSRVIYLGTFAKLLFPALRIGFMVLPQCVVPGVVRALSTTGQFPPLLLQAALADFIEQGHMTRHLRRMRRIYSDRRRTFGQIWREVIGDAAALIENDSGIQVVGLLPNGSDDIAIAAAARQIGINVAPLSMQYRHEPKRQGLLLGYAAADEPEMRRGLTALKAILSGEGQGSA